MGSQAARNQYFREPRRDFDAFAAARAVACVHTIPSELSRNFASWYGPPVALGGVPGTVFVIGGGDFIGECRAGSEVSGMERAFGIFKREERRRFQRAFIKQRGSFSSLSALISAGTNGKGCRMTFNITAAPTAVQGCKDTWMCGPSRQRVRPVAR